MNSPMDRQSVLRMTLLAFEETVRAVATKADEPSSSVIDSINDVFAEINKEVEGSHAPKIRSLY